MSTTDTDEFLDKLSQRKNSEKGKGGNGKGGNGVSVKVGGRHRGKAVQEPLIDVEPEIPEVVRMAATNYLDVLVPRIELQQKEPDLRSRLVEAMKETGCKTCLIGERRVTLKENFKIVTEKEE